ncbi:hypothetical protein ACYULU_16205 [Breznakiellaceae bacterium SP9]
MAKIGSEENGLYREKTQIFREAIKKSLKQEEDMLQVIKKDLSNASASIRRLALVEEMLNLSSNYIIISGVSESILKIKDQEALEGGRKSVYKGVIYLEQVVSNFVDAGYTEYEDKLALIEGVSAGRRYLLVRKLGLTVELLENAFGPDTKWRWTWVDLEGRVAAVSKNIFNLKNAVSNNDPRSPDYEPTVYHLRLIKKLLNQAADRYREKYELATKRSGDFKVGINFLGALRKINSYLGDREGVEIAKKKFDIWTSKLETDIKKQEEEAQKKI